MNLGEHEKFKGIEVERTITVDRPISAVYHFWRNPENLPKIMCDVKKVTILDDKRSHWVVRGPLGTQLEWDSELTEDVPDKLLGWKSVGKGDVKSVGRVEFAAADSGEFSSSAAGGTKVRVYLKFSPPGGRLGFVIARFLGNDPSSGVTECLLEFKHLMEREEEDFGGAQYPHAA